MTRHHPTRRFARRLATTSLVSLTTNRGARGLGAGPQKARVGVGESRPAPPALCKHGGGWHRPVRRYRAGVSWVVAAALPSHLPERDRREASSRSRAMDESGELGDLETMETLTELGDELTLGDIDGEWRVRGWECGGARGGRGYGGARGCTCAPRPELRLAPHARSPQRSPAFPGAADLNPSLAAPLREAAGSSPGATCL